MDFLKSIICALTRNRVIIIIITVLTFVFMYFYTNRMRGGYEVEATLYTGIVSGINLESEKGTDWGTVQNSMDNLMSIIQAESTLRQVSMRLFARVLMEGEKKDNIYRITTSSYKSTYEHLKNSPHGKEILALIDKNSEDKTVSNFANYAKPEKGNYIYEMFYYTHPYYSSQALRNIKVKRRLSSDLLDVSYVSGDPGIAFNTVNILMDEFVNEYRRIRYGETDKVIEYFKGELERIGKELGNQEDKLTEYNVEKRIINYYDETKEIAAINKEFELREQNALFAYNSSKAMIAELEKHMDGNAKQVLNNLQFIDKLKEASKLTGNISEIESTNTNLKDKALQNNKAQLTDVRRELSDLSNNYIKNQYSKEGVARTNVIEQWLDQTLSYEKAKAELQVVQQYRQELNDRYIFFAPVGTTIKQKERSISFMEQSYLSILQSYNEALMRKKNLEMTSATLKVLNEPFYPINSSPTNRKQIVFGTVFGSLLFIIALIILIEILDRTLRDSVRAKRVTGYDVIAALPKSTLQKYRAYLPLYTQEATKELSNGVLSFCNERKKPGLFIVNLLSTTEQSGKEEVAKLMMNVWIQRGLKVKTISYKTDFKTDSSLYLLATSVEDFYTKGKEDMLIVEYPPLEKSNVPSGLLQDANINLLIAPADRGWKNTDQILVERIESSAKNTPLRLCLTQANMSAVEDFTGQLPPYTLLRSMSYRFSQLALTERLNFKNWKRAKAEVDNDDE